MKDERKSRAMIDENQLMRTSASPNIGPIEAASFLHA